MSKEEEQFLKKQQDERKAELNSLGKVDPKKKKAVNESLRDKIVSTEQSFTEISKKNDGVSAGFVAIENETKNTFILKQFNKDKKDSNNIEDPAARYQSLSDREDGVRELLGASMYQFLLYDRAPKIGLVVSDNDSKLLYVRSKFFEEVVSMPEFTGKDKYFDSKSDKLKAVEGFEKVMAACHILGEGDYHDGNIMIQDQTKLKEQKVENGPNKHVFTKIDHGKSFLSFHSDFSALVQDVNTNFNLMDYNTAINNGNLSFNTIKYSDALKQMVSQFTEEQINNIVDQKVAELQKAGFDFKEFEIDATKKLNTDPELAKGELSLHYKDQLKQNLSNMKQISEQIEIVAKFTSVDEGFKNGKWVSEIAKSGCKSPIEFAAKNGIMIEGKDPLVWAYHNKKQIEGKSPIEFAAKNGIKIEGKNPTIWLAATRGEKFIKNLKREKKALLRDVKDFKTAVKETLSPQTLSISNTATSLPPAPSRPNTVILSPQAPLRPNTPTPQKQTESSVAENQKTEGLKLVKPAKAAPRKLAQAIGKTLDRVGKARPFGNIRSTPPLKGAGKNQGPGR